MSRMFCSLSKSKAIKYTTSALAAGLVSFGMYKQSKHRFFNLDFVRDNAPLEQIKSVIPFFKGGRDDIACLVDNKHVKVIDT